MTVYTLISKPENLEEEEEEEKMKENRHVKKEQTDNRCSLEADMVNIMNV